MSIISINYCADGSIYVELARRIFSYVIFTY